MKEFFNWLQVNGVKLHGGVLKNSGNGHQLHAKQMNTLWQKYCSELTDNANFIPANQFEAKALEAMETYSDSGDSDFDFILPTVHTIDDLVCQALDASGMILDQKGETAYKEGVNVPIPMVETAVKKYYYDYVDDSRPPGCTKPMRKTWTTEIFVNQFRYYVDHTDHRNRLKLRQDMAFKPENELFTIRALDHILRTWRVVGDAELSREVFRHWMWQTKRYVHGLPVRGPIFLNVFGTQGSGKSTMLMSLCRNLKEYSMTKTLDEIMDQRNIEVWSKNYMVFFEELSLNGMDSKSMGGFVSTLKQLLTADEVSGRIMHSTKQQTVKRTFSPLSASNDTITNVIHDPTGMRRFFEIVLDAPKADGVVERCEEAESLPVDRFWSGIDHTLENGYIPITSEMYKRMAAVQATYRRMEAIDWAIDGCDYSDTMVSVTDMDDRGRNISDIVRAIENSTTMEEVDKLLEGSGLELTPHQKIRMTYHKYLEQDFAPEMAKYLPMGERFVGAVELRGYAAIGKTANKKTQYHILCLKNNSTASMGVGI